MSYPSFLNLDDRTVQTLINLAAYQLEIEDLCNDPYWAGIFIRPDNRASADELRTLVKRGRLRGIDPDRSSFGECAKIHAQGMYIQSGKSRSRYRKAHDVRHPV